MSNAGSDNASLAREIAAAGKAAGLDIDENLVAFTIGYVTAVDDKESILIKNIQAMNRNAGFVLSFAHPVCVWQECSSSAKGIVLPNVWTPTALLLVPCSLLQVRHRDCVLLEPESRGLLAAPSRGCPWTGHAPWNHRDRRARRLGWGCWQRAGDSLRLPESGREGQSCWARPQCASCRRFKCGHVPHGRQRHALGTSSWE